MILFFILLIINTNILAFNISQNLINLLVFFIIFFIISVMYKNLSMFDILLREKEQSIFLEFLIKLRLLICFYIRYVEIELYNIYMIFMKLKMTLERALISYNWTLAKAHKNLVNRSVLSTLTRIIDTSSIIYKQLNYNK
jgi:hypothetical protein